MPSADSAALSKSAETSSTTAASADPNQASKELLVAVDDLLDQMRTKFNSISQEMLTKMDDMSKRLDSLEANMKAQQRESANGGRP